jgi:O-antigen/teichoic acid export membrane protein
MSTKFYDNIDIIIIETIVGAAATGVYGIGFRFSLVLKIFAGAVSKTSGIELSRHSAAGDRERVREILTDATVFATVLSIPAFVGMLIIGDRLIETIYTDSFSDAAAIAILAVGIQIPDGFRSVFSSVLQGLDRPDITYRSGLIVILSNISLNLLLVPTMGPLGAIIASLVSVTASMAYIFIKLFALLNIPISYFPYKPVLHEVFAAVMMGVILIVIDKFINLNVVPSLIILISTGAVTYFIILFIISAPVRGRLLGIIKDISPSIIN